MSTGNLKIFTGRANLPLAQKISDSPGPRVLAVIGAGHMAGFDGVLQGGVVHQLAAYALQVVQGPERLAPKDHQLSHNEGHVPALADGAGHGRAVKSIEHERNAHVARGLWRLGGYDWHERGSCPLGCEQLLDEFNYSQTDLAKIIGKSRSHVANTLRLLKLPENVKAMVRDGRLSAGHARTLIGLADPEARAREILAGALNVREAEQRSQAKKGKIHKRPVEDPNTKALEESISNSLGLKVQILHKGDKGGEVRISYKSLEQLDDLTHRLKNGL